MTTVRKIKEQINKLQWELTLIEGKKENQNVWVLVEEISNLIDGVGDFSAGDYYAPDRLYSRIPGVKNIRFEKDANWIVGVEVKVTSPAGRLLPSYVKVRGEAYPLWIVTSKNYSSEMDY